MKVLFVTPELPPFGIGGVSRYAFEVCSCLRDSVELTIANVPTYDFAVLGADRALAVRPLPPPWRGLRLVSKELIDALAEVSRTGEISAYRSASESLVRRARAHLDGAPYDVAYVQDYSCAPFAEALRENKIVRSVVAASHLPLYAGFTYFDRAIEDDVQQVLEAMMVRLCRKLVVPSQFAASVVRRVHTTRPDQIVVNPHGVTRDPSPRRHEVAAARPRLGSVLRFTEQKGLDYLVELAAHRAIADAGATFAIIGSGSGRERFLRFAERRGVAGTIELLDHIPEQAMPGYFRSLELYVSTALYETFGLSVLEAMEAGVPLVAFDVGALSEVVGSLAGEVLVPVGDVPAMVQRICELSRSAPLRRALGDACRERARAFSWTAHTRRLLEVFEEALP